MTMSSWDERYQQKEFLFGKEPNAFLARQDSRLAPGLRALAVADGEGRNGVWMAQNGLDVLSIDSSAVAQRKAAQLAAERGVVLDLQLCDLAEWEWPQSEFDVVAAIFIQFAGPKLRQSLFQAMKMALRPGGLLLLQGYRPEQIAYGTGGPSAVENLYTEDLLRTEFADFDILELASHDSKIEEGDGHRGPSALIDLVARRPIRA